MEKGEDGREEMDDDEDDALDDVSLNLYWEYTVPDHKLVNPMVSFFDEDRGKQLHPLAHYFRQV